MKQVAWRVEGVRERMVKKKWMSMFSEVGVKRERNGEEGREVERERGMGERDRRVSERRAL